MIEWEIYPSTKYQKMTFFMFSITNKGTVYAFFYSSVNPLPLTHFLRNHFSEQCCQMFNSVLYISTPPYKTGGAIICWFTLILYQGQIN